jgi:hypothetical protein
MPCTEAGKIAVIINKSKKMIGLVISYSGALENYFRYRYERDPRYPGISCQRRKEIGLKNSSKKGKVNIMPMQ